MTLGIHLTVNKKFGIDEYLILTGENDKELHWVRFLEVSSDKIIFEPIQEEGLLLKLSEDEVISIARLFDYTISGR